MIRVALHLALAGGVIWWAGTEVDPLICFALYAFGLMVIDGPKRRGAQD
jgi:hypothetical protein